MNDLSHVRDSWWLASLGNTLIWARLRIREAGTAEVLDSDGNTLSYDSEDTARSQLFDAEFVEYDGLDGARHGQQHGPPRARPGRVIRGRRPAPLRAAAQPSIWASRRVQYRR